MPAFSAARVIIPSQSPPTASFPTSAVPPLPYLLPVFPALLLLPAPVTHPTAPPSSPSVAAAASLPCRHPFELVAAPLLPLLPPKRCVAASTSSHTTTARTLPFHPPLERLLPTTTQPPVSVPAALRAALPAASSTRCTSLPSLSCCAALPRRRPFHTAAAPLLPPKRRIAVNTSSHITVLANTSLFTRPLRDPPPK